MEHFFLSLHMDLSEKAPEGAGWYIVITTDTGRVLDPVPVSVEAAQELASAAQTALQSTEGEMPSVSVPQLVAGASGRIAEALRQQLQEAENHAARIPSLRKKLALVPPKGN